MQTLAILYEFLSQLDISYVLLIQIEIATQKNHNKVSQEEKSNRRNLLKRLSAIKYKKFIEKTLILILMFFLKNIMMEF